MKNRVPCPSVLRCGSVALLVLAAAAAQQQPLPGPGTQPQQPQQALFQRSFSDQLQSTWVQPRPQLPFTGFPVFPSRLSDYSKGPGGGLLQALVQGQGLPGLSIPG